MNARSPAGGAPAAAASFTILAASGTDVLATSGTVTQSMTVLAASASSISVIWSTPSASEPPAPKITGYTAVASPGGATRSAPTPRGCLLTGLKPGATYSVVVRAINEKGASDPSTPVEVRTKLPPSSRPTPPRNP